MSAITSDDVGERFEVRTTADSHFAWIRTRLSLERTLMSWIRTSVALIGFGFTIVQFFERLSQMQNVEAAVRPLASRYVGLSLIAAGVLVLLISARQYYQVVKYLWSSQFGPICGIRSAPMAPILTQTPVMAVTITMIVIGLFAFFAVMFRLV